MATSLIDLLIAVARNMCPRATRGRIREARLKRIVDCRCLRVSTIGGGRCIQYDGVGHGFIVKTSGSNEMPPQVHRLNFHKCLPKIKKTSRP